MILRQAGLGQVNTFGVQAYLPPQDKAGPTLLGGVVRSLAAVIVERGIATAEQLGLETLEERIAEALQRADAVLLPPTVVGDPGESPPRFDPCHARDVLLLDQERSSRPASSCAS